MKSIFIAVLLLTVNAFGAVHIPTQELQLALERGKVLTNYGLNQQQSRLRAYTVFDQYIDGKLGQVGQGAVFTACPEDKKQKISRFVRTLLNFVGWSSHSKALLDSSGKTYNQYLNLIDVISPYETSDSAKNNLKIAKARLQRLALESQKGVGQTYEQYEQAHPGALSRGGIYNLLAEVTQGVKVRLIEKADLIVTCGYSPTGNQATDLDLAEEFMDQYSQVKHHGYFHRQHPRAGAARKRTATAVPYLSIKGSEVSGEISNRADHISARIAMLRNALPVNGGGAGNGGNDSDSDNDNDGGNGGGFGDHGDGFDGHDEDYGHASDDDQNDGFGGSGNGFGFASAGASSSSTSASSSAALTTFGSSSSSFAASAMEQDYVASSSFLTPTASDSDDDQGGSDNDDGFGGSDNVFGFASAGASAAYDSDDSDFPRSTAPTKKRKSAIIDSSDEEEVSKPVSKKRFFLSRGQIQERNKKIRAALEANPELDRSEIAKIAGPDVTAQNVFDYIHRCAQQFKKPGRSGDALAEKQSRIRAAFEADLESHQQGNPRKTYAEIAAIAGPDVKVANIERFIDKLGEEGKQFKRGQSRSEKQDAQERIRRAIEENSGKPLAEIARIAGSDVTTDAISNFKKKHKLTKKTPTKAEVEAKKKTVIAIKTANPQVKAAGIIELAAQQGCEVTEGMVHKYIAEAGLQERRPVTTKPLTQQQKDDIVRLRDEGESFPKIATTVGCTEVQAYKYYNKDKK